MKGFSWLALALAATLAVGCSQHDQRQTEAALEGGAQQVGHAVKEGAKDVGQTLETGMDTAKVKSALMASEKMDASNLNVDKEGNVYYLRGSVPSEEQKALAERMTTDMIGKTDKVVNELKVGVEVATPTVVETSTTTVEKTVSH